MWKSAVFTTWVLSQLLHPQGKCKQNNHFKCLKTFTHKTQQLLFWQLFKLFFNSFELITVQLFLWKVIWVLTNRKLTLKFTSGTKSLRLKCARTSSRRIQSLSSELSTSGPCELKYHCRLNFTVMVDANIVLIAGLRVLQCQLGT